jgi:hypothetical protein
MAGFEEVAVSSMGASTGLKVAAMMAGLEEVAVISMRALKGLAVAPPSGRGLWEGNIGGRSGGCCNNGRFRRSGGFKGRGGCCGDDGLGGRGWGQTGDGFTGGHDGTMGCKSRGCIGKFKVRAVEVSHCKSIFYVTPTKDTEQIEIPSNPISHFAKPAVSQLCNWRATLKSPLLILNQSSHTDVMANLRSRGPRGIIRTGPLEVRSALSASPVLLREISPSLFSRATMTNRR